MKVKKVSALSKGLYFKIFINDLPHVIVSLYDLVGIQSWIHSTNWYSIQFNFKEGEPILCEYDDVKLWTEILRLINENIK